jgi:hypothetical protein
MRCKDVYILDVYVIPFLFASLDHTSMPGHVWGMCALVGAILQWFEEVTIISGMLRFSPFYGCLTREKG